MCRSWSDQGGGRFGEGCCQAGNKFCAGNKVFAVDELATPSPLANAFFIKAADPLYVSVGAQSKRGREERQPLHTCKYSYAIHLIVCVSVR